MPYGEFTQQVAQKQAEVDAKNAERQYFAESLRFDAIEAAQHLYAQPRNYDVVVARPDGSQFGAWAVRLRGVSDKPDERLIQRKDHTVAALLLSSDGQLLETAPVCVDQADYPITSPQAVTRALMRHSFTAHAAEAYDQEKYNEYHDLLLGLVTGEPVPTVNILPPPPTA